MVVMLVGAVVVFVIYISLPFMDTPSSRSAADYRNAVSMFEEEIKAHDPILLDILLYIKNQRVPDRHREAARKLREKGGV